VNSAHLTRLVRRAGIVAIAAATIGLATAAVADANPAPYYGPAGAQINTAMRPFVQYNVAGYGNDCTMAVGFHNNQSVYGGNGDAQGDATLTCDGTRVHNFTAYTTLWAWLGNQWVREAQGSTSFTNARYGMGAHALLTGAICNSGILPAAGVPWLVTFDLYIDGVHRQLNNMPAGAAYYNYLPNHC
jgi:hypothetical protein